VSEETLATAALLASMTDETPEGQSIVDFTEASHAIVLRDLDTATLVPFTAQNRMSGVDVAGRCIRKGAPSAIEDWVLKNGGTVPSDLADIADIIAEDGGTPLAVAERVRDTTRILGVVHLKDQVKYGSWQRVARLRDMGVRTVMITADNPLTARAIAKEAGVDDFLAEATPEDKLALIRREQRDGRVVAVAGDGADDAPALAQADVGLAMNTGSQAAKEAANMVDLDSDPGKLFEVVEVAKQLLVTRGSLTTFSIANDVAKYFAIIPAIFAFVYPKLGVLNFLHLGNPHTAILSAVIYSALIIPALIPLALRGVRFTPRDGAGILRRSMLFYGLGGVIAPFVFIKLLDLILVAAGLH
jgi:K+-transporting ATPase ATPase B chain